MQIQENVPLAPYTTLKIGGPARYFAHDTREALTLARQRELPLFVLGSGSNLVVSDAGFPGVVLQIEAGSDPIFRVESAKEDQIRYEVEAGTDWDLFVRTVCEAGISGVECLAGIPGTVGAAPVQNIGAYGQEVSQVIDSVLALDRNNPEEPKLLRHNACEFAYRRSIFNSTQRDQYVILRVSFEFDRKARPNLIYPDLKKHFTDDLNPTPLEVYHAVRAIRAAKGMLIDPAISDPDTRSAGSFFKNPIVPFAALATIAEALSIALEKVPNWPVASPALEAADPAGPIAAAPQQGATTKLPAAWLIEQAGFPKGYRPTPDSTVGISTKHTLALVNRTGTATCAELLALRDEIIAKVRDRFGVTLEQEPVYLS